MHDNDEHLYDSSVSSVMSVCEAAKDIAFGSIAGMVSEVFEYPFDLAKVRLQAQLLASTSDTWVRFNGPLHCLTHTWETEGIRGLYRGLPAPIVGSMVETAGLFVSYTYFQNLIRRMDIASSDDASLTLVELGTAASCAGFVTSFILTPIELIKCKMQVQTMRYNATPHTPSSHINRSSLPNMLAPQCHISPVPLTASVINSSLKISLHNSKFSSVSSLNIQHPGIIAVIKTTISSHGMAGLWIGHTGTVVRETGGTAAWFVVKEWVARCLLERREPMSISPTVSGADTSLRPWESALSGAIAGALGAMAFYPADTIKSAMQTEERHLPLPRVAFAGLVNVVSKPTSTFWNTATRMWDRHGIRGLYAGCGMTVARATFSSGIIFVVYDGLTTWFGP